MPPLFRPFICTHLPIPTSGDLHFTDEEAAESLNAYLGLWQPELLARFSHPPKWCGPGEIPTLGEEDVTPVLFIVCNGAIPPSAHPEGSIQVQAGPMALVQKQVRQALSLGDGQGESDGSHAGSYPALGLGILLVDTLFEAQNHSNLLQRDQFWECLQSALRARSQGESDLELEGLREAANHLVTARETLSSTQGFLVDFTVLPEGTDNVPASVAKAAGLPRTLAASGSNLVHLAGANPAAMATLRSEIESGETELVGGCFLDREELGLPLGSILWNLDFGQEMITGLAGKPCRIHYRAFSLPIPSLPGILRRYGFSHQVLPFDRNSGDFPPSRASLVSWSWGDSMGLESFAGSPLETGSSRDMLHVARRFSDSMSTDYTPALLFRNGQVEPCQAYKAFCQLAGLAPVFGKFSTMESLFRGVSAGDYWNEAGGCEFGRLAHVDKAAPCDRNWLEASSVFDSLARVLGVEPPSPAGMPSVELQFETSSHPVNINELALGAGRRLADRILKTGEPDRPGVLLLNPNSFNRRVIVDLEGPDGLPVQGPVLASESNPGGKGRAVVEIPGLGFAWIPRGGIKSPPPPRQRWHLADERGVRNEFLEAEFDPATGGLRGLRDLRHRIPRLQQAIQAGKGCSMLARSNVLVSKGPARGELESSGDLVDGQGKTIGGFTQTLRAWIGRPLMELEIKVLIQPEFTDPPPAIRLFWRDPSTEARAGLLGQSIRLTGDKAFSADYIHLTQGANATSVIGSKPLKVQRKGNRYLDIALVPGEASTFSLSLGFAVDRDYPHLLARGWHFPFLAIPVEKGPPATGATGWLIHVDSPSVNLERLRARSNNQIEATFAECLDEPASVGLSFAKPPKTVCQVDDLAEADRSLALENGSIQFDMRRRGITTIRMTSPQD